MGEAWLARPTALAGAGDLCVVKRLISGKRDRMNAKELEQRFRDESRVSLLLDHPCVCRTLDAGRVGDASYLAFELVEGIDLRGLYARVNDAMYEPAALHIASSLFE